MQDRQQMELAQTEWLKAQMGITFSRRLLRVVRDITKLISAASQDQAHRFPSLAGSHLSAVRSAAACTMPGIVNLSSVASTDASHS